MFVKLEDIEMDISCEGQGSPNNSDQLIVPVLRTLSVDP